MVKNLEIRQFDVEAQLFILQCLLEMQADQIIYEGSIMSFEAILMHQYSQTGEIGDFDDFKCLMQRVNKTENL